MFKTLSALLLLSSASPALSSGLDSLDTSGVKEIKTPSAPAAEPKAAYQHVWMSVRSNPASGEAQANDYGARIEARVQETSAGSFSVNLRTDMDYGWASIRKSASYYSMSGSGIFLNMNASGGSFFLSGNVTGNGGTGHISVNISRRFDDFSYSVYGSGINLNADRNSISGSFDPDRVSRKAMAAVVSMILALQVEKGGADKQVPQEDQPR